MGMSMICRKRKMNGARRLSTDFITDSRTKTDFLNSSFILQNSSLLFGLRVVRFGNDEVMRDVSAVVGRIKELALAH